MAGDGEVSDALSAQFYDYEYAFRKEYDLVDKIGNVIAFADAILDPQADASVSVADTLFFVQTCMPKYVSHLLKRDDIDEENALFVADLLKRGIDLTLHMGQFDYPDVFKEILARVFNDNYNFYATYGTVMDDMALYDSDEDEAAALAAVAAAQKADALAAAAANGDAPPGDDGAGETGGDDQPPTPPPRMSKADADRERRLAVGDIYAYVPNVAWDVSQIYVDNLNHFGKKGGFDLIVERLARRVDAEGNAKLMDMGLLKLCLKPLSRAKEYWDPVFAADWVPQVFQLLSDHCMDLSDEQLKVIDKDAVADAWKQVEILYKAVAGQQANEDLEKFTLAFGIRCLRSPYLEKRLAGHSDIKDLVNQVGRKAEYLRRLQESKDLPSVPAQYAYPHVWMSAEYLVDWIREVDLMNDLYGDDSHMEIKRRCIDIIKFLSQEGNLSTTDIDMVWQASVGKHEAVVNVVYTSLIDLAQVLSLEHLEYLYNLIVAIPPQDFTVNTLALARHVTIYAINGNVGREDKQWYGMELFWAFLQDNAHVTDEVGKQALDCLVELLSWPYCYSRRQDFILKCVENLSNNTSIWSSLNLLGKVLATYPQPQPNVTQRDVASMIEWLAQQHNLLDLLFANFAYYKEAAAAKADKVKDEPHGEDWALEQCVLVGKQTHLLNISERLNFLNYCLTQSTVSLTVEHIDTLWDELIVNPLTIAEREDAYLWFETTCAVPDAFTDDVVMYIYKEKIPTLDVSALSSQGFLFFEYFFRFVNWKDKRFEQANNKNVTVLAPELLGIDFLWSVCFQAGLEDVGSQACRFVLQLYQSYAPALKDIHGAKREEYISNCLGALAEASTSLRTDAPTEADALKADRALFLLRTLLDEYGNRKGTKRHGAGARGKAITITVMVTPKGRFTLKMHTNETVGDLRAKVAALCDPPEPAWVMRIITAGRELKEDNKTLAQCNFRDKQQVHGARRLRQGQYARVEGTDEDDEEAALPSSILTKEEYFDQVFDMLYLPGRFAEKVWGLLMFLPTNPKLLTDITRLNVGEDAGWDGLLDAESTFKLYYCLQIVESQIFGQGEGDEDDQEGRQAWCTEFVAKGGVQHLLSVLMDHDLQLTVKGGKRKPCLALLLKLVSFFILNSDPYKPAVLDANEETLMIDTLVSMVDIGSMTDRLVEILWRCADPNHGGLEGEEVADPGDVDVTLYSTLIFISALLADSSLLNRFYARDDIVDFTRTMLLGSDIPGVRGEFGAGLYRLCLKIGSDADGSDKAPLPYFTDMLLTFLPSTEDLPFRSAEYFVLLNDLVRLSCTGFAGGDSTRFAPVLDQLVEQIKAHPILEQRFSEEEDHTLIGILNVVATLSRENSDYCAAAGTGSDLVREVFHTCLFDIPTVDNHGALAPPKCKTVRSRVAAFKLLVALAKDPENFRSLSALLLDQHKESRHRGTWHFLPSMYEKSPTGLVGLENLGATCYMNSLMQQFYMIPKLRYGLLSMPRPDPEEDPAEDLLFQLQTLFGNLQESERKYYATRPFTQAYKDYDGNPMNPLIQMDVDEFFNMLLDRLENIAKGSDQERLLKDLFGGVTLHQIICKAQGHVSEREEPYFTMSVPVKDKKHLHESLDLYVEGDMLEGNNKYNCSYCGEKVDALKRCCIGSLPNTLIMHLKRFEFDFEVLKRMKVNEYFEFPTKLNMAPWTKEGLAKKEALEEAAERGEELTAEQLAALEAAFQEQTYYEYELTGVLVHAGTAETGHYYSFVKSREPNANGERLWYRFNDTVVEEMNEEDLAAATFGGVETVNTWDQTTRKTVLRTQAKNYNAYMLFYQRAVQYPVVEPKTDADDEAEGDDDGAGGSDKAGPSKLVALPPDNINSLPTAERANMVPREVFNACWEDNQQFLTDKNVFDIDYFNFLADVCHIHTEGKNNDYNPVTDGEGEAYDPLFRTIKLSTQFVMETLVHAKQKEALPAWCDDLKGLYSRHIPACCWFISQLIENHWAEDVLLDCTIPEARDGVSKLITHVLATLAAHERAHGLYSEFIDIEPEPEAETDAADGEDGEDGAEEMVTVMRTEQAEYYDEHGELQVEEVTYEELVPASSLLEDTFVEQMTEFERTKRPVSLCLRLVNKLMSFLPDVNRHWRNYDHYFAVVANFSAVGPLERTYMLERHTVARMIHFYLENESPHFVMPANGKVKLMGDKFRAPPLNPMITLIANLIRACVFLEDAGTEGGPPFPPGQLEAKLRQTLAEPDYELLISDAFFSKAIRQNINAGQTAAIVTHLAWEAEGTSVSIIKLLVNGILMSQSDELRPYFAVLGPMLSMEDSLQGNRVRMAMSDLVDTLEQKGEYKADMYQAMRAMAELANSNAAAREWLFENTDRWLLSWLVANIHDVVRDEAEDVVIALVPQLAEHRKLVDELSGPTGMGPMGDVDVLLTPADYTEETVARIKALAAIFLDLMPQVCQVMKETDTQHERHARVVAYFRLLCTFTVFEEEKLAFAGAWEAYWELFFVIDACHYECDDNKAEMTRYWRHVVEHGEGADRHVLTSNIKLVTDSEEKSARMMDFFVSLRPNKRYLDYNKSSLPDWYRVVELCCLENPRFVEIMSYHRNWDWAVKNLYRESSHYPPVAKALIPILEIQCAQMKEYRQKHLPLALQCEKLLTNYNNVLPFLNALVVDLDDAVLFCQHDGLEQISQFIDERREIESDDRHLGMLETALRLYYRSSHWMTDPETDENFRFQADEIKNVWDSKGVLQTALLGFLAVFADPELRALIYTMVFDLVLLDETCAEKALTVMFSEHEVVLRQRSGVELDALDTDQYRRGSAGDRIKFLLGAIPDQELELIADVTAVTTAYYAFVLKMVNHVMENHADNARQVQIAIRLLVLAMTEMVGSGDVAGTHAELLAAFRGVWGNEDVQISGTAREELQVSDYIVKVLSEEAAVLGDADTAVFVGMVLAEICDRLDTASLLLNTIQKMNGVAEYMISLVETGDVEEAAGCEDPIRNGAVSVSVITGAIPDTKALLGDAETGGLQRLAAMDLSILPTAEDLPAKVGALFAD